MPKIILKHAYETVRLLYMLSKRYAHHEHVRWMLDVCYSYVRYAGHTRE